MRVYLISQANFSQFMNSYKAIFSNMTQGTLDWLLASLILKDQQILEWPSTSLQRLWVEIMFTLHKHTHFYFGI